MKLPLFSRLAFGLFFLLVSTKGHAQALTPTPTLPGYWNLETNLNSRDYTFVRFYNAQDQLVYEERLASLCLDLGRGSRRCRQATTRHLNEALQQVLRDPTSAGPTGTVVAQQFSPSLRTLRVYAVR